jgi:serine/arginine repetitive matrix protein 2
MPIVDDEDEEDVADRAVYPIEDLGRELDIEDEDEVPLSATSSNEFNPEVFNDVSPRASSSSKSVFVESEISPENFQSFTPASSPTPISQPASLAHATSDSLTSPQFFPTRLSIVSRTQGSDRSPLTTEYPEWDDSPKRIENPSATTWEKVKNTFSRAGSNTGRRSRTNSILTRERRDQTDSSVSRESGASLTSAKTDKADSVPSPVQVQAPPLMQSPSASASILSLAPHAPPRGSVSPIPPASSADMSKYRDAKLFPFPGMLRLEEERRAKGYPPASASSPDVSMQSNLHEDTQGHSLNSSSSNTPAQTPELNRERTLSHQNSDSRLVARYGLDASSLTSPPSSHHPDYINASPSAIQNGNSYKLPMTLPGVKQWLSKNSKKKTLSPGPSSGTSVAISPTPIMDMQPTIITDKKSSLFDIVGRKENEPITEWEDVAPNSANSDTLIGARAPRNGVPVNGTKSPQPDHDYLQNDQTPKVQNVVPLDFTESPYKFPTKSSSLTRLYTPSSVSDYPAATASESSSTTSSQLSLGVHESPGSVVLERLDEKLARGTRSPMWASALDDPPRRLILSSPVLQVVNPNTVKDRFLFLFSDVLVIAKPITWDQDKLIDAYKPSLPDRKYAVKSVVLLRNIRFCSDRSEGQPKTSNYALPPRNPLIRSFISQFSKDPDHAITSLFTKSNLPDNSVLLGQLLLKTLDLDRSRLGEYLSKRTSKVVLKSYLDSFGFAGLRVDVALRVFLHSVNVPRTPQTYGYLEHLLDSFTSRWYEANARFVAYDKDMAIRLVRAIVQLNELLHDGIAEQPGPTDHVRRTVTSKEFQDAFRKYDTRCLVSDELLAELYRSIFHERLCQACADGSQDIIPITVKRQLPARLTYKAQSEPIIFRLPQADPLLSIKLYGQDLVFDPPVLQFSRNSEASFRVTGSSLGSKTITMCRSGPNAVKYSGLPLSHTVVVERAFMRNTFQLAFLNQTGAKRRYMFSIDDTIIRNEWATSLKRHIDLAYVVPLPEASKSKFYSAAEATAFKVLQDTLMGSSSTPASLYHPNSSYSNGGPVPLTGSSTSSFTGPLQIRSKSRSKIYGTGKNEADLGHRSPNSSCEGNDLNQDMSNYTNSPDQHPEGHIWTARDLEMYCLQNSSIPLVLSYLQVGAPDHTGPS